MEPSDVNKTDEIKPTINKTIVRLFPDWMKRHPVILNVEVPNPLFDFPKDKS